MEPSYNIVIADDHPLFRNALYQAVHMAVSDANLLEADTIDGLLQLLEQSAEVDLLLLDLKMPGANGFSGLTHLRGLYPDLPIVVVSASEEESVIKKAMQLGAMGFIPKSSPMKQLVTALNQILDGEGWLPEGIDLSASSPQEPGLAEKISLLTPQQYRVLVMLNEGLLNKQIAFELGVSEATIKAHVTAIFRKLEVSNRTQAVIALQQLEVD
ncbi:response regulator [Motilimonas pumila]|uniref:DNA-binding response regulator n=1 Tax=Motilimonas pumila TaxID=2303987 RepID=A0A418YLH4_9GAMM|nr:response regulator transcription factor [Motilimonas pumila]RJG51650.1 DNA-binding response regulator [Motilimonas pumila]